jgi:flagellum-specific ATP synthase
MDEPIADTVRGILDGHIVLSRKLAHKNHFPAIDVLQSISRLMSSIASDEHKEAAAKFRNTLAVYEDSVDLINIGAYAAGSNPDIDNAIKYIDKINGFLKQRTHENVGFTECVNRLRGIFE